jgi:superfamily II DNA or RNA helicase
MTDIKAIPSISVTYAHNGSSAKANTLGMRPMQEKAYERRGEQFLLIKSPPASGKSRALMFIALDKLAHQGLKQAIIVVPERSIGASFHDEPLTKFGFWADWHVEPKWNLCNAPGGENGGKVKAVGAFLASADKVLVCTHATFRFAVDEYGVEAFDDRLIAVDEFHHVSSNPDNKLGLHLSQFIARSRVHLVAMTGSYFRGDAEAVLTPLEEARFDTVTYTYYEQLNGYDHLKQLDMGYFFYSGSYVDDTLKVLDVSEKTIIHIPNVNSRESTKDKIREVEHIIGELGEWQGVDDATGFQLVKTPEGKVLRIADLVDDDAGRRDRVSAALKDPAQKHNRDYVDIIIALGMAKEGFDWIWCEHALTVGYRSSLTEIVQIIGRATRDAPGKTAAIELEAARAQQAFASIEELARRVPSLSRADLATLAEVGALNSIGEGSHRRDALWQVQRAGRQAGPLLESLDKDEEQTSPLQAMNPEERMVADYAGTGVTVGRHPMAHCRDQLRNMNVCRADDLRMLRHGVKARIAGCVIARQRPGTAHGFIFLSIEDETGISNAIIDPELYERNRSLVTYARFLLVEGTLQNVDKVIHIRAKHIEELNVTAAPTQSHDFH